MSFNSIESLNDPDDAVTGWSASVVMSDFPRRSGAYLRTLFGACAVPDLALQEDQKAKGRRVIGALS